jgi:hypothetical protein
MHRKLIVLDEFSDGSRQSPQPVRDYCTTNI